MSDVCKHGQELTGGFVCDLCTEEDDEPMGRIQVGFDIVEVQKVGLQEGDVLMVTVKNDDIDQASLHSLQGALSKVFPKNKLFVFCMGIADDVKLTVISQEMVAKQESVGYCSNCNCGKKERAEKTLEGESDGTSKSESCCGNQCGNPEGCST